MNLDQIKKDLEEFKNKSGKTQIVYAIDSVIEKHLEELIDEVESFRTVISSTATELKKLTNRAIEAEEVLRLLREDVSNEALTTVYLKNPDGFAQQYIYLQEKLKKAEEVIRFYGDIENHQTPSGKMGVLTEIVLDRGQKAIEYLSKS